MADVSYPDSLRLAIQSTKRRDQAASYRESNPAGGPPYFEAFGDDVPIVWAFNLRFTRSQAMYFWSWVKSQINNGRDWFNMPIGTEYDAVIGQQVQEVHFTESGFPQLTSENNDVLTYSCEVVARSITKDDVTDEFIFQWFDLYGANAFQAYALDRAINIHWPEA